MMYSAPRSAAPTATTARRRLMLSAAALTLVCAAPGVAFAQCTPNTTNGTLPAGTVVTCTGVDADGFNATTQNNISVLVNAGATLNGVIALRDFTTIINNGVISTSAATRQQAIYAGFSATIVNNGTMSIAGAGRAGIFTDDDAIITINGSLSTSGSDGYGIDTDDDSSITISSTGSITTTGVGARGIVAGRGSSVFNAGLISATGASGDGVLFDEGNASLINTGTITSGAAYGVVFDRDFPGTGSTLENRVGGVISGARGSILSAGTATADATAETVINAGSLIGDVALGAGDDRFVMQATGTFTGNLLDMGLGNDVFVLDGASHTSFTGLVFGSSGTDTFVHLGVDTAISADTVYGFELLEQRSGRLRLIDDAVFDQSIVYGGELALASGARLIGDVDVRAEGTLSGAGTIDGDLITAGAIVIPGGADMTVTGGAQFRAGSVLRITASDFTGPSLDVRGAVTVEGGRILIGGLITQDRTLNLIQAGGGFLGSSVFDVDFAEAFPFVKITDIVVGPDTLTVEVDQLLAGDSVAFSEPGRAVAAYLLAELTGAPTEAFFDDLSAISDGVDRASVDAAMRALSPEVYATAPSLIGKQAHRALTSAISSLPAGDAAGVRVWARADHGTATLDGQDGYSGLDLTATAAVMGVDRPVGPAGLSLGILVSVGDSEAEFASLTADLEASHYAVGGYATFAGGPFSFNALVSWGHADIDARRVISVGAVQRAPSASFGLDTLAAHVEGAWRAEAGGFGIVGLAAFDFLSVKREAFTETGGGELGLVVADETLSLPSIRAGVTIERPLAMSGVALTPRLSAHWVHEIAREDIQAVGRLAGGSAETLAVGGAWLPEDRVETGLGVSVDGTAWSLSAGVTAAVGPDYDSVNGGVNLRYRF